MDMFARKSIPAYVAALNTYWLHWFLPLQLLFLQLYLLAKLKL